MKLQCRQSQNLNVGLANQQRKRPRTDVALANINERKASNFLVTGLSFLVASEKTSHFDYLANSEVSAQRYLPHMKISISWLKETTASNSKSAISLSKQDAWVQARLFHKGWFTLNPNGIWHVSCLSWGSRLQSQSRNVYQQVTFTAFFCAWNFRLWKYWRVKPINNIWRKN